MPIYQLKIKCLANLINTRCGDTIHAARGNYTFILYGDNDHHILKLFSNFSHYNVQFVNHKLLKALLVTEIKRTFVIAMQ